MLLFLFHFYEKDQYQNMGKAFILIITISSLLCQCECYTSIETMKEIHQMDIELAQILQQHLNDIEAHKNLVQRYLSEHNILNEEQKSPVENPILSLQLMRRIVINKKLITNSIDKISKDLEKKLELDEYDNKLSYTDHLREAALGLLRLQDTYLLHPQDISHGKLLHTQTIARLTPFDCLTLANIAKDEGRFDSYVEWTEQADRLAHLDFSSNSDKEITSFLYGTAKLEHDDVRTAILEFDPSDMDNQYQEFNTIFPNATDSIEPSKQRSQLIEKELHIYKVHDTDEDRYYQIEEMSLCHKGSHLTASEASQLSCYFLNRPQQPFLSLFRFQVEVRSMNPLIITIYDVVSDQEAELIKSMATPTLQRSEVATDKGPAQSSNRISETSWLYDTDHATVKAVTYRVGLITGLKTINNSEALQVVNYGIGGMYNSHYDFYHRNEKNLEEDANYSKSLVNNRILTFLIYLSDVEMGGATAFPKAKVAAPAIKNAATMWYNLNAAGEPDFNTVHAGCPVLYGSKWIANKWVEYGGQLFHKQCTNGS